MVNVRLFGYAIRGHPFPMPHNITIAFGVEGAWIARHKGQPLDYAINLPLDTTLQALDQWLSFPEANPHTYTKSSSLPANARSVFFDPNTGKLVIHHPVKSACQEFDPASEESMAKFVRTLKALSETYTRTPAPELPFAHPRSTLPNIQVFSNPAPARGYVGQGRIKPPKTPKGPVASIADIDAAFAELFNLD